ncbi:MAG TPA: primosomal protein N' [Phycisphaerae bacterium]|nr:primosomal protein N' [Phycisphaerae bacterium]
MAKLFDASGDASPTPAGTVVGLAVNANVWRTFDYIWPSDWPAPAVGQRVRVPFGRGDRKTLAFVAEVGRPTPEMQLKAVGELIDQTPLLDETLWELAQWISRYYLVPLGIVLAAMVPSAVGRHAARSQSVAVLQKQPHEWPSSLGGKQKRLLDELYEAGRQGVEELALEELLHHSAAARDSVQRLVRRGLVRLESRPVRLPQLAEGQAHADPFELNDDQQKVMESLSGPLGGGFSTTLLYGVTGSGKTEIYIQAIRRVVEAGRQAILLVPEIALATQTLQRLVARLPRVAVLHSGLTGSQRAFYYEQIRDGHADAVVGPRSAVFAPTRRLGLIVVDEEHEPTYKQDNAPRYHARDVAVKRASLTGVPVILGTATPSLESMHNVRQGRYHMLRLPQRVRNLPMPRLQIVPLRKEMTRGRIELIGRTLTLKIAAALDRRKQVILLMNRRGYASYLFCPKCRWIFMCEHCSRPMVYHRATDLAMCHHCDHTAALPAHCPACKGKLLLFGYGVQRIESELGRKFPAARVARMDSDTMTSPRQFRTVFDRVTAGEIDILLGTQMVAKGLDFPGVSLVGVASADTALAIPDFRAAERTFQLVVQVAGRAGRGDEPGEVVVQTLHEDEPAIRFATRHDYDGFAAQELPLREEAALPPYSRIVRFIVRHADVAKAERAATELARLLRELLPASVSMIGPQRAGVFKVRNQLRFHILLQCGKAGLIQQVLRPRMAELTRGLGAEVLPDVDPVNLL